MDILSLPIEDAPFSILDVETTGFSPKFGDKICEIAILRIEGEKEKIFHSLINPGFKIPEKVKSIHGITDDMVSSAPYFIEVIEDILNILKDSCIVGHNIYFDIEFLKNEMGDEFKRIERNPVIDTLKISKVYLNQPSNSLKNLTYSLGLGGGIFHRALEDVYKTKNLLFYIIEHLRKRNFNLKTLSDLFEIQFVKF